MVVKRNGQFKFELKYILEHIAKDKLSASKNFRKELNEALKLLPIFPYKHRKSYYYDNDNIRDLIFKGYTVIYEIYEEKIEVITIFNQNIPIKDIGENR